MADNVVEETLASRIDIEQFSKLELYKSTTARVLKLYQKCRSVEHNPKAEPYTSEITTKHRERAERLWIEDVQRRLKNDVNAGKYVKLCPRYEDGIIVVDEHTERWMDATWNRQRFIDSFCYLLIIDWHIRSSYTRIRRVVILELLQQYLESEHGIGSSI